MVRHIAAVFLLLLVLAPGARAGEYWGRYQYVDLKQVTVTLRVDGRDHTFPVAKDARFYDDAGRELKGGLRTVKDLYREGQDVSYASEKRGGREWLTLLRASKPKR
jgi:hypothetical protein